mgnify:FL=1
MAVGPRSCCSRLLSQHAGASFRPWLRFQRPLIEPDLRISRIRLSESLLRRHSALPVHALAGRKSSLGRSRPLTSRADSPLGQSRSPHYFGKHDSSRGPSLQRHYPLSPLLWPPPTSRQTSGRGLQRLAPYTVPYDGRACHRSVEISSVPSHHLPCVPSLPTPGMINRGSYSTSAAVAAFAGNEAARPSLFPGSPVHWPGPLYGATSRSLLVRPAGSPLIPRWGVDNLSDHFKNAGRPTPSIPG